MKLVITKFSEDRLTRYRWDFWMFVDGHLQTVKIRLSYYCVFQRDHIHRSFPSKPTQFYDRIDPRYNTIHFKGTKPVVPEEIKEQAVNRYIEIIKKNIEWEI